MTKEILITIWKSSLRPLIYLKKKKNLWLKFKIASHLLDLLKNKPKAMTYSS